MDKFSFSRFNEKRNYKSRDTTGYDEYVEGVEPEETMSLETHIGESNMGYRLVQKMGWKSGTGLGKDGQGRLEPVPLALKDDNMGLGRWTYEVEQAQDTTDKRRQMETEKEITSDLVEKYKAQAEKEDKLVETILEMNKSFYCDLCDKQYFKYSEYDNHLNSYDHHHRQRLKELKQWEAGRKFGGHREEEEKQKLKAAYEVAVEKAYMLQRQSRRKTAPGFKPIGGGGSTTFHRATHEMSSGPAQDSAGSGVKRSSEDGRKAAEKKSRLSKYGGLNFQSAGNLVTVGDKTRMDEDGKKGRGYQDSVTKQEGPQPRPETSTVREGSPATRTQSIRTYDRSSREGSAENEGSKFSFGFSKKKTQSQPAKSDPSEGEPKKSISEGPKGAAPGPPPLMSRQRELMTKAFGGDSDSDEEEGMELTKMAVRGTPRFMFHIRK
jgi:hypothetical protein